MIESIVSKRTRTFLLAFTIFLAAVFTLPLYSLIRRSLEFVGLENYAAVIRLEYFNDFFVNSLLIACSTLVIRMTVVSLAAYAFSKLKFPGRDQLFVIGIIGLFTPPFTLLVSLFKLPQMGGLVMLIPRRCRLVIPVVLGGIAGILSGIIGGMPWPEAIYIGLFSGPTAIFAHEAIVHAILGKPRSA